MRALQPILALFWQTYRRALLLGLGLSCLTLACGAALPGLAGWFIAVARLRVPWGGVELRLFPPQRGDPLSGAGPCCGPVWRAVDDA